MMPAITKAVRVLTKNDETSEALNSSWQVRLTALAFVTVSVLMTFELAAWVVYNQRENVRNLLRDIGGIGGVGQLHLDSYEMADPITSGHWRLRPGFVTSSEALIAEKKDAGKWLGVNALLETRINEDARVFKINSSGFKGPELNEKHRCPRILAIGDSTTFGIGNLSYPDFMRLHFAEARINAEVINAGVEGYSPRNVLNEMPRYLALKPEIVTIYIGWNSIFDVEIDVIGAPIPLKSLWLIRNAIAAFNRLMINDASSATRAYKKESRPNAESPVIEGAHRFTPAYFDDITKIVDSFRAIDTQVYLITLMGMFQLDRVPSATALEVGHLPSWTDNPFELAALVDRNNDLLKRMSEQENVNLIDLQAWGRERLKPSEAYFFDSVHFNTLGLQQVGAFLASRLVKPVQELQKSCDLKG